MSAKEMFEELGYEWKESKNFVEYTKYHYKHWLFKSKIIIIFYKVSVEHFCIYDDLGTTITQELLQAINKQVEELGWK